jgi:hypothetical protein
VDEDPATDATTALKTVLAAVTEAYEGGDVDRLAGLLHPDGLLVTRAHGGAIVSGRDAWIEHLRTLENSVYAVTISRRHLVDAGAAILEGRVRYPLEQGGFADEAVAWLLEFEDGLLWRATPYRDVDDARAGRAARLASVPDG